MINARLALALLALGPDPRQQPVAPLAAPVDADGRPEPAREEVSGVIEALAAQWLGRDKRVD